MSPVLGEYGGAGGVTTIILMAQIKNTGTLKEIQQAGNLQSGFDQIPTEASKSVVYTMEVNPKLMRVCNIVEGNNVTTSGSATVYTTPTNKDFYLTSLTFGITKDVTCDTSTSTKTITVVIDGATKLLLGIPVITLTASSQVVSQQYNPPIKLDRGSIINNTFSFTAGVCIRNMNITGYTVENQGA